MNRAAVLGEMAARICAVETSHTLRVGINGIDAAGKTTLADELAQLIRERGRPVIRASIDGFHNPRAVRYERGPLSPDGYYHDSFNLPVATSSILAPLGPSGDGIYRSAAFDYRVDAPVQVEPRLAPPGAILLFDGIFLARPELIAYWDVFIFVQISFDTCLARAWERNSERAISEETLRHRYQTRYLPAQRHYLATCRPMDLADMILVNDDPADPRLKIRPNP
jgi:uridine kinase